MKKVLLYGLSSIILLVAIVLIIASIQPAAWHVERSIIIKAPRETVWKLVSDLNRYEEWSPYARLDTAMQKSITGAPSTVGASYSWDSEQVGAGKMTIIGIKPNERVDIKLEFLRPFATTNAVAFILAEEAGQTKMSWTMDGEYQGFAGLIGKTFSLIIGMDQLVGKDFEDGLALVQKITEEETARANVKTAN